MNIWAIESKIEGVYYPVEIEYSRDNARVSQRLYKKRVGGFGVAPKTRIRRYTQDSSSRG